MTALWKFPRKTRLKTCDDVALILIPAGFPQITCSRGIGSIYKFFNRSAVPQVELSIDLRANIFGASYEADALQNKYAKNDRPLRIPFSISYAIDLRREVSEKMFPDPSRWYVIALGGETNNFFHIACHLASSSTPPSRCEPVFWCIQSWYMQKSVLAVPWGERHQDCSCSLGRRKHSRLHGYVSEGRQSIIRRLLGVILVGMDGSGAAASRHCLVGFW